MVPIASTAKLSKICFSFLGWQLVSSRYSASFKDFFILLDDCELIVSAASFSARSNAAYCPLSKGINSARSPTCKP